VGEIKRELREPQRDYSHEKQVVSRAREQAIEAGVQEDVVESIFLELIRAASAVEEQDSVRTSEAGDGRRVLVIGGAGKMGGWMSEFLHSQGFHLEIADRSEPSLDVPHHEEWEAADLDVYELIVVATPLGVTNEILLKLAEKKPQGVVFDVGSLKSPVREGLRALVEAGVRATSIHPMFGPATDLLSGRHIIFADVGCPEATKTARELFAPTTAVLVDMDLESHDRLIAYVLGLSHALNIAFFTALAESGETAPRLAEMSSTTFDAQLDIARNVSEESPDLYYEIQALNDYGSESLAALSYAVERIRSVVRADDQEAFRRLMLRGRAYLKDVHSKR
jgi:chorismate mutase/prephenate dehydrogenase